MDSRPVLCGSLAGELAVSVRLQLVPFEAILTMPMPEALPPPHSARYNAFPVPAVAALTMPPPRNQVLLKFLSGLDVQLLETTPVALLKKAAVT